MTPAAAIAPRHAAPAAQPVPTIPADTLAFAIGDHDDANQIRAFWVREDHTSHLEIEGGGQKPGESLKVRLDQMVQLAVLLRESDTLAKQLGGAR